MLAYMNSNVLARIGMYLLNKLTDTTGRAHDVGCSGDGVASKLTISRRYSDMSNRLTAPTDSLESQVADSEVHFESHAAIQPI
jgi:hypothetical protein